MDTLRQEVVYALRALRTNRAFALTVIFTLALGIGASTAIFTVVNAVLLRPLPYQDADRLVLVWGELRARELKDFPFPAGDFQDLKEQTTAFEDLAAITPGRQPLAGDGNSQPEQIRVTGVTTNLFKLLGARVAYGRDFNAEDAVPVAEPPQGQGGPNAPAGAPGAAPAAPPPPPPPTIVILNHDFWQRRFGGDPAVVGRTLDVGGQRAQVVGILAPGFEVLFPPGTGIDRSPDMFNAMRINYETASRLNVFLRVIGKLKPGISIETAREQAERVAADLRQRFPIKGTANLHFDVQHMHEDLVADVRQTIVALMGAVAFVLLIACANVANLLLVRAAARGRDFAVRAALGSSPWRLVRQMLVESLVLGAIAALVGVLLAYAGVKTLIAVAPTTLPRLDDVRIDGTVLAFSALVTLGAVALFGLVPAVRAARANVGSVLRAGGRNAALQGGGLLRNGVVVAEVALTLVLLVGGGLMVRSFVALLNSDPGYDPRNVLTFVAGSPDPRPETRDAFVRSLQERLRGLPGVTAVTAATPIPLDEGPSNARYGTEEAQADPSKFKQANVHIVLPGYFEAMRTRLIAGRAFTATDNDTATRSIVIDQVLAAKTFPGQSAVGKRLLVRVRSPEPEWLDIIGVVAHQRHETLVADGREAIFVVDKFMGTGVVSRWVVRTSGPPEQLAPAVRAAVRELDPQIPVAEVQPFQALVDRARAPTRFALVLITVFAGVAALLAAVGLYGVLATAVRQRTAEIGVRIAIGAPVRRVFGLVIGEGLRLSAIGVVLGLGGALLLTRVIRSMLVGVEPTDPTSFAAAVAFFLVVAVLACWIPARRAARLDPTQALRSE